MKTTTHLKISLQKRLLKKSLLAVLTAITMSAASANDTRFSMRCAADNSSNPVLGYMPPVINLILDETSKPVAKGQAKRDYSLLESSSLENQSHHLALQN